MKRGYTFSRALLICGAGVVAAAHADVADDSISRYRFSGFGTLGTAYTQGDDLHMRRDLGPPDAFNDDWAWKLDSLLGAQLNADFSEQFEGVVQVVVKERARQQLSDSIERAYLSWRANNNLTVHAGRLGLDFYMMSDYRDVSFAFLWQRPPTEFYAPLYQHNIDGLDFTYRINANQGSWTARMFYGKTEHAAQLNADAPAQALNLRPLWGGTLSFENEHWRSKVGFVQVTFDDRIAQVGELQDVLASPALQPLWPEAAGYANDIDSKGEVFGYYSIGGAYDDGPWTYAGELGYLDSDWNALPKTVNAYISIGHHIGAVTPYVLLAISVPLQDTQKAVPPAVAGDAQTDAQLNGLHNAVNTIFHTLRFDQNTVSFGARWDVDQNIAIKMQWDHASVAADGIGIWWNATGGPLQDRQNVNVFSASINWMY